MVPGPEFFWEDVGNAVAMLVHNLYFVAIWLNRSDRAVMTLMLCAYVTYLFNCAQFILRGLQARRAWQPGHCRETPRDKHTRRGHP
ncbi:MAG: 2-vinyl bacteriochlorophyllide hydratase [Caldilineaceae bacterium]